MLPTICDRTVGATVAAKRTTATQAGSRSGSSSPAVAGLGMALVASTLVNVVLAQVPATEAGAASGLVNTAIQIGVAAGIALIGAILFSLLGNGDSFVTAATGSLWVSAGLLVASAALSFVLPPGRIEAEQHSRPAAEPAPEGTI
jgi:hypothetical protein